MAALRALWFILPLALAAPALYITSTSTPTGAAGKHTIPSLQQPKPSDSGIIYGVKDTTFLLPVPGLSSVFRNITSAAQLATTNLPPYPFAYSFPTANASTLTSLESNAPTTVTVTMQEPIIIPMPASPTTITQIVTKTEVDRASPIPTRASPEPARGHVTETWAAPSHYSDLSPFKVTKYLGPDRNLKVVTGIPAQASAHPDLDTAESIKTSKKSKGQQRGGRKSAHASSHKGSSSWNNDTSVIQIFYPEGSINPARDPIGGAEFYGSPIDVSEATNVTFEYSVFFPADFDWVKAGKLPGLYGGHPGCSGGNAALDCFSTRLMWRTDGAGELYLYAPKDKQTKSLCDDPQSTCDAAYGLSIGRGSFHWAPGAWTTARQTLVLNTPGKTDGVFTLDVNGERVIDRHDVMYRDRISPSKTATKKPTKTNTSKSSSTDGGLLGPIVSGVLGGLKGGGKDKKKRGEITRCSTPTNQVQESRGGLDPGPAFREQMPMQTHEVGMSSRGVKPKTKVKVKAKNSDDEDGEGEESEDDDEVKLVGIFFSTFFGGHEDDYATPRDQYAWFKDFSLSYNA